MEGVWVKEQKQIEDQKKHVERMKKLQEERHNEELKRMQVEAGHIPRSYLDRQEWMYDYGNKLSQQKSTEEYLLGKPVDMNAATRDKKKEALPQILKETITNDKCESFSKVHEDPLFIIRQEEERTKKEIIENPLKMKDIYKELSRKDSDGVPKKIKKDKKSKKDKKAKKDKKSKKDRKEKKQKERERSQSKERDNRKNHKSKEREY